MSLVAFSVILNSNLALITFDLDANDSSAAATFNKYNLASNMLGVVVLYSVKAAFLTLCRASFGISTTFPFHKAWWTVVVYTLISFWILILMPLWQCGNPSAYAAGIDCLYS